MLRLTAVLFLCMIFFRGIGQKNYVLEGTAGNDAVVMFIEHAGQKSISGKYYLKTIKRDVVFNKCTWQKGLFKLERKTWDTVLNKPGPKEYFLLKKNEAGIWKGKLRKSNGKDYKVLLQPVDTCNYKLSEVPSLAEFNSKEEEIYSKIRLSGIQWIKDSTTKTSKYLLDWYHEPTTNINAFRIKTGYTPDIRNSINDLLAKQQMINVNISLSAADMQDTTKLDYVIRMIFMTDQFFSLHANINFVKKDSIVDFNDDDLVVDTKTGQQIKEPDALFWFTGKKPLEEKDDNYNDYLDERSKALVSIMTKLYPKQMKLPTDNTCNYTDTKNWERPYWFFTPSGLYIGARFPRESKLCDRPAFAVIPYEVLKNYTNKEMKMVMR
ncbi:hypothetical protein ACI6Q2_19690 [Chitinophagaceae bacterium LWZ2-11]